MRKISWILLTLAVLSQCESRHFVHKRQLEGNSPDLDSLMNLPKADSNSVPESEKGVPHQFVINVDPLTHAISPNGPGSDQIRSLVLDLNGQSEIHGVTRGGHLENVQKQLNKFDDTLNSFQNLFIAKSSDPSIKENSNVMHDNSVAQETDKLHRNKKDVGEQAEVIPVLISDVRNLLENDVNKEKDDSTKEPAKVDNVKSDPGKGIEPKLAEVLAGVLIDGTTKTDEIESYVAKKSANDNSKILPTKVNIMSQKALPLNTMEEPSRQDSIKQMPTCAEQEDVCSEKKPTDACKCNVLKMISDPNCGPPGKITDVERETFEEIVEIQVTKKPTPSACQPSTCRNK